MIRISCQTATGFFFPEDAQPAQDGLFPLPHLPLLGPLVQVVVAQQVEHRVDGQIGLSPVPESRTQDTADGMEQHFVFENGSVRGCA